MHLPDLRLQRPAVEGEQGLALAHRRAVPKVHPHNFAVDAGLDRDAGNRRDAAKGLNANGNSALGGDRDLNRDRADAWPGRLRNGATA